MLDRAKPVDLIKRGDRREHEGFLSLPVEMLKKVNQPTPVPITDIKPHYRKPGMKYAMTVNGINHYWSGRGRMPKAFNDYVYDHNNGVMISYNEREEFFKRFLIEENEQ